MLVGFGPPDESAPCGCHFSTAWRRGASVAWPWGRLLRRGSRERLDLRLRLRESDLPRSERLRLSRGRNGRYRLLELRSASRSERRCGLDVTKSLPLEEAWVGPWPFIACAPALLCSFLRRLLPICLASRLTSSGRANQSCFGMLQRCRGPVVAAPGRPWPCLANSATSSNSRARAAAFAWPNVARTCVGVMTLALHEPGAIG